MDTIQNLSTFLSRHATPYDPASDTYRRPPFAAPVKATKATRFYDAHSYYTKVPPQGIVPYILHYTDPGDLILDLFCGSGMTGVAALMCAHPPAEALHLVHDARPGPRYAILNDLSPAATHIAYNYCTPVDVEALKRAFERIKAAVKEEFDRLYGTTCDRCGGPATIRHIIFKQVEGRWYLRGEQVIEGGLGLIVEDEASAIAWLSGLLGNEPQTTGDLIPKWQVATRDAAIAKSLDQILEENFWREERTGRWRLPTKEERRKMSAKEEVSAQAHLRVIRRYLEGSLDRRPGDLELCAWIRFCYNREFYTEAVALFPHVDETRVDAEEYRRVRKIVEVCRLKVGR